MTDIANEPDDQMSLVRFLVYANQFDVEGLVATTSTWLKTGPRPDVILSVLDAYEQVQPNLLKHAQGFPAAADLRKLVAAGQPAYGMASVGADKMTPGAELILRAAGRQDPRPLWVLAWGGTNTLAQALMTARATRTPVELEAIVSKLRVYAIADQDDSGAWLRREFPSLLYIASPAPQNGEEYYLATWTGISGDLFYKNAPGADFSTFTDQWINANIRSKGPLGKLYPYPCCIHEGDTPSFLNLIDNGLAGAMSPAYGGWGGRYVWRTPRGEAAGVLDPGRRLLRRAGQLARHGGSASTARPTPPTRPRSGDGARRSSTTSPRGMDWTIKPPAEANHNPRVVVNGRPGTGPVVLEAQVGLPLVLDAAGTTDPDGHGLKYSWFFYPEAGTGIPDQPVLVRQRPPPPAGRPAAPGFPVHAYRPARAAAAPRDRERRRARAHRRREGARHRARDSGGRRQRHAKPHVVPARHPEHEAGPAGS